MNDPRALAVALHAKVCVPAGRVGHSPLHPDPDMALAAAILAILPDPDRAEMDRLRGIETAARALVPTICDVSELPHLAAEVAYRDLLDVLGEMTPLERLA